MLQVVHDGTELTLPTAPKQRLTLAVLLSHAGRSVSVDTLTAAVWAGAEPPSARRNIHQYVHLLRLRLGAHRLPRRAGGYAVVVDDGLDSARFERAVATGRAALTGSALRTAADTLRPGLDLWRAPAYQEFRTCDETAREADRLERLRLDAYEWWAEAKLGLGEADDLLPEFLELARTYQFRESVRGYLMLALYHCGRRADALAEFHQARMELREHLGVEPGPALHRLYLSILRDEVDPAPRSTVQLATAAVARNDLPRDLAHFTGRTAELTRLVSLVDGEGPAVVLAIDGMAGVGKTALAVHAAHRLADRFPDGQLFIDLHGHTAGREPLTAEAALDVLLRAVGVPDDSIPKDVDEKAARWRAALADRRLLVVLDNAGHPAQVRPLLPGSPDCAVLVTSRRRLVGLDGIEVLSLDTLPAPDAVAMFGRIAGADHTGTAVGEVVRLCGYLPLAIGIAAARLRTRPTWTVGHLVDRLTDQRGRPTVLEAGDHGVAAAFSLSYQHLPPDQQRLFRLLGLHPGGDIDPYTAAALARLPVGSAGQLLDALCDMHLLIQHRPDRYRLHDLVGEYARACAEVDDTEPGRAAARGRLLDYYLQVTETAADLIAPHRRRHGPRPEQPPADVPVLATLSDAWSWFHAEQANLPCIARLAARHSTAEHEWQIPRNIAAYLGRSGRYRMVAGILQAALAACRPDGDPIGPVLCLSNLAAMRVGLGEYRLAFEHLRQALPRAQDLGDPFVEAVLLTLLAIASNLTGAFADAVTYASRAAETIRGRGDRDREAEILSALVEALVRLGRHEEAIEAPRLTGVDPEAPTNERNHGVLLSRLGTAHSQLGHHDIAIGLLLRALDITRYVRDRPGQATCLYRLADALRRTGRYAEALDRAHEALHILHDIDEPAGLTETHNVLGAINHDLRRYHHALVYHQWALITADPVGYRIGQAQAHQGIGRALSGLGSCAGARRHRRRAAGILTELGVPR